MKDIEFRVDRTAELIINKLLAVKPGEQVAIVGDPESELKMVDALSKHIQNAGAEFTVMIMPARDQKNKNDLTRVIEYGLAGADCLIGITRSSGAPTYSGAVKKLYNAKKLRGISMVMRSLDNFTSGGALADYGKLSIEGKSLAKVWENAERIRITTPLGTDISAPIAGELVIVECGFATQPGQEAAFSDGEVSQMPREKTTQGVIFVDGPIAHIGKPQSPIKLTVKSGRITSVEGSCNQARELHEIITKIDHADNIAEFGIGLNPDSRRNGDFEEEKKARGCIHIAIGDNVFYGGGIYSPVHMDMVIYNSTVQLDDHVIVDHGRVVFLDG